MQAILCLQPELIKKGAEADIYLVEWGGRKAISKVRTPKLYRHVDLDSTIRRQRTVHEARFMSASKRGGITSPFVYFVDPEKAEIIMEYIAGDIARDVLTPELCIEIGKYSALLHAANIIHGDLTTSNFIVSGRNHRLVLIDFGLAFYSERIEDAATDIRLIKEAFTSAHVQLGSAFDSFVKGYAGTAGEKKAHRVLENVHEIEQRGRYARVT